ncbi:hypothetical protein DWF04_015280 [Cereibacter sphaeroides f. sp. denitrificans]|nr:hypothetical protein DWF04_16635 [Cereibacter sphaeroides f. sp. denitrificans]
MTENTTPAPAAARQLTPIQSIAQTLESDAMAPKIAAALGGTGISPERFTRAALAALSRPEAKYSHLDYERDLFDIIMLLAA